MTPPPSSVIVIGAGLAGAAVAAALARRGCAVTVLDGAAQPAAGASSLPVGLMAPHISKHDSATSQLSRLGIARTTHAARALLREGVDWQPCGALQYGVRNKQDGQPDTTQDLWHPDAAWLKPAALVRAWLATPGVQFAGGAQVARLQNINGQWHALQATGSSIARADGVVIAAATGSGMLLQSASSAVPLQAIAQHLHAVAGQVIYGPWNTAWANATPHRADQHPHHACNGNGHFIAAVPVDARPGANADAGAGVQQDAKAFWLSGSTYEHDVAHPQPTAGGISANAQRLTQLLPRVQAALTQQLESGQVTAWAGQRCTTRDRLPVVGAVSVQHTPGLYVCTAMGSRGLSFAALCADVLVAQIYGQTNPLPTHLASALDVARFSATA
jgi:tRNA 5-methylaminomethyl-2-thiouridine biosynthesis bifunctional protein